MTPDFGAAGVGGIFINARVLGLDDLNRSIIRTPYLAESAAYERRHYGVRCRLRNRKEVDVVHEGPTMLDWLWSIDSGRTYMDRRELEDRGSDTMSPPIGWGYRRDRSTGVAPSTRQWGWTSGNQCRSWLCLTPPGECRG